MTTFVPPSASATICMARSAHPAARASVSSSTRASGPTPLDNKITESLVDVQPSTVISLNECRTALLRACCSASGDDEASVVSTASMVAMFGASIAAPLAMPPRTKPFASSATCLILVSVVRIAFAAAVA